MRRSTRLVTRRSRIITAAGVVLIVLVAYGALGGWGGANATHSSCGTYCWNVYAPYTGSTGVTYSETGSGNQWNYGPYAQLSNGELIDSQQNGASWSSGQLYTYVWIQADQIHFYAQVGVTYTFKVLVEAQYNFNDFCNILPGGQFFGSAWLDVVAGLAGTSYSVTQQPLSATDGDWCYLCCTPASGPGNGPIAANTVPDSKSGGWGGYVTLTLAIPNLPAGYYSPYVEIVAYTYGDASGSAGVTSLLNVGTGGYFVQWTNVNINWGPGMG